MNHVNWHDIHLKTSSKGDRLADFVANLIGSWKFIIIQSAFVAIWMLLNVIGFLAHWDAYPFILLNLLFSTQAAYAAPIIMMSQNRQSQRDRVQAQDDYECNIKAKNEIEALQMQIRDLEMKKIDQIIKMLEELKTKA